MKEPASAAPSRKGLSANWAVREVDHLFGRFKRYTKFVLYSKWFLGLFAILLIGALVVNPMLVQRQAGLRVSFIGSEVKNAMSQPGSEAPSMATPVYEGTDTKGRPYRITGTRATQLSADVIVLEPVEGTLDTGDSFINLTADKAEYSKDKHRIELTGNVNVVHGKGYTFVTPQATVDTSTMNVTGSGEVTGEGPMGNLLATGFEIRDNGNQVNFGSSASRVNVLIDKSKNPS